MPRSSHFGRVATAISGALLVALGSAAFAGDAPAAPSAPSRQMRERMATLHEQMAACLRSDKSMSECRTEMLKHCQSMMGSQGCTMTMGSGGMTGKSGGTMGMGHGMHGCTTSSPPE